MARILLADDGIVFDGTSLESGPLGGVESSVVNLMTEFAKRGHEVHVRNNCANQLDYKGVSWRPIAEAWPKQVDLYIANRGDKLIRYIPNAKKTVFWVHNPARYLMKWRYLSKLWLTKPTIIFIGQVHEKTYPGWAPGGERVVIPYGLSEDFCNGILDVITKGVTGKTYHFSSESLYTVKDIVFEICKQMKVNVKDSVIFENDRMGKDDVYKLDSRKTRKELKWKAKVSIKKGINKTINYINNNFEKLKKEKINFKIN